MDRDIWTRSARFSSELMRARGGRADRGRSVYIGYLPASDQEEARYRRGWGRGDRRLETLATRLDAERAFVKNRVITLI